jgi:hypothetical protein
MNKYISLINKDLDEINLDDNYPEISIENSGTFYSLNIHTLKDYDVIKQNDLKTDIKKYIEKNGIKGKLEFEDGIFNINFYNNDVIEFNTVIDEIIYYFSKSELNIKYLVRVYYNGINKFDLKTPSELLEKPSKLIIKPS